MKSLQEKPYPTRTDLEEAIYSQAEANGFAAVIRRSRKRGKTDTEIQRVELECCRGRKTISQSKGKRQPTTTNNEQTRRNGCPWKGYIRHYKQLGGQWKFILKNDSHSHEKLDSKMLPANRRRHQKHGLFAKRFDELCRDRSFTSGDVVRKLGVEFPCAGVLARDVQNKRDKLKSDAEQLSIFRELQGQLQHEQDQQQQQQQQQQFFRLHDDGPIATVSAESGLVASYNHGHHTTGNEHKSEPPPIALSTPAATIPQQHPQPQPLVPASLPQLQPRQPLTPLPQPRYEKKPPKCTVCGVIGHCYNSPRCPKNTKST